jgi:hypothetical protein
MTTLELFNLALGMIGHDRTISALPSTSTEAVRCNTFYESARRAVFALKEWRWLAQDATITTSTTRNSDGVTYVHAKPSGLLRVLDVTSASGTPLIFDVVGASILTDAPTVILRYIADSTDPSAWPPIICDAVAAELAARICLPMTGNAKMALGLRQQAAGYVQDAAAQYAPDEQGQPDPNEE